MPEVARLLIEDGSEGVVAVAVAPGTGEYDDAEVLLGLGEGCCWEGW